MAVYVVYRRVGHNVYRRTPTLKVVAVASLCAVKSVKQE